MFASQSASFYESHRLERQVKKGLSLTLRIILFSWQSLLTDFLSFSEWRPAWLHYHNITHQRITWKRRGSAFYKHLKLLTIVLLDLSNYFVLNICGCTRHETKARTAPSLTGSHRGHSSLCCLCCVLFRCLTQFAEEVILKKMGCFHWPFYIVASVLISSDVHFGKASLSLGMLGDSTNTH